MKPTVIQVFGDKSKKLEPEQHRIEFPGGAISVERTTTGEYWAHITINRPERARFPETHIGSKLGQIVGSRIDYDHDEYSSRLAAGKETIPSIENQGSVEHIAIRFSLIENEMDESGD